MTQYKDKNAWSKAKSNSRDIQDGLNISNKKKDIAQLEHDIDQSSQDQNSRKRPRVAAPISQATL